MKQHKVKPEAFAIAFKGTEGTILIKLNNVDDVYVIASSFERYLKSLKIDYTIEHAD